MMMHWLINWVIEKSFDLPVLHFVDDIERNLEKELNFNIESENSKIGKINFQKMGNEYIIKAVTSTMCHKSLTVSRDKESW